MEARSQRERDQSVTGFLNSGSAAPYAGGAIESLVRRVGDMERAVKQMQTLLVNGGHVAGQRPTWAAEFSMSAKSRYKTARAACRLRLRSIGKMHRSVGDV